MKDRVRVRFAPSPTGALHIGGLRTALFNYLFAKKHGGDFLLRIEDTDSLRYVEGAEQYIIEALNWCGIAFDEGIGKEKNGVSYRQSERKALYRPYVERLIELGAAYYAFDTAEDLERLRCEAESEGRTFIYNWSTREKLKNSLSLLPEQVQSLLDSGQSYVVRFKISEGKKIILNDLIRGEVVVNTDVLDDKVLFKSDGMPTYHLANIVDDHLMEITHVIRGEEWLPSLALHKLIYEALGWEAPEFAHLPLILKPVGNGKLSKRDGQKMGFPVFPIEWEEQGHKVKGYREEGYFPEALVNFLALLGWNPGGNKEIFSMEELIENFDLERVHKSGARFDPEKIKWFNHQYLQMKSDVELSHNFSEILDNKGISVSEEKLEKIVSLLKERATFVSDFYHLGNFFFSEPKSFCTKALKKHCKENTSDILSDVYALLSDISDFSAENIERCVKAYLNDKALTPGQLMPVLRLSIVGEMKGPDIFQIMQVIEKQQTLHRIKFFISSIDK